MVENRPPITGNVANAQYGRAVAASSDGSRFVIGAGSELVGANANQGAVYVYVRTGSSWTYYPRRGLFLHRPAQLAHFCPHSHAIAVFKD